MDLIAPWETVEDVDRRQSWEAELLQEIGPEHLLSGLSVKLIGRLDATDDALFLLEDNRVAEVHLSWSRTGEKDPNWPATVIFGTLEEWKSAKTASAQKPID